MKYSVDTDKKELIIFEGSEEGHKDRGNYLTLKKMFKKMGYQVIEQSNPITIDMDEMGKYMKTTSNPIFYGTGGSGTYTTKDFVEYSSSNFDYLSSDINTK